MPRVETIEALAEAVQAFEASSLGFKVDPEADAAVRESLQRTGLVLLGERHGIEQTPALVEELITWFGLGGIVLEWDANPTPVTVAQQIWSLRQAQTPVHQAEVRHLLVQFLPLHGARQVDHDDDDSG